MRRALLLLLVAGCSNRPLPLETSNVTSDFGAVPPDLRVAPADLALPDLQPDLALPCTRTLTKLVDFDEPESQLLVAGGALYWLGGARPWPVFTAPAGGGNATMSAAPATWEADLVSDGVHVFYTPYEYESPGSSSEIDQIDAAGATAVEYDYDSYSTLLAVDADTIYFTALLMQPCTNSLMPSCMYPSGSTMWAIDRASHHWRKLADLDGFVYRGLVSGGSLYVVYAQTTANDAPIAVARADASGLTDVLVGLSNMTAEIASDDGVLYARDDARIVRVGDGATLLTGGTFTHFTVAGGRVFVAGTNGLQVLERDGSLTTLATDLDVQALARDEDYVYVAAGDIYRVCR